MLMIAFQHKCEKILYHLTLTHDNYNITRKTVLHKEEKRISRSTNMREIKEKSGNATQFNSKERMATKQENIDLA